MDLAERWRDVDGYLVEHLVGEDDALSSARAASRTAGLPEIEVAANQAKLLALLCRMSGARRILEFGTLGGYSTIWLARAVGADGHVTTLEIDPTHAEVARENFRRAGVADRIRLIEGPAADSARSLIAEGDEPYDLVFIDADKPNNPAYVEESLRLSRPGTVIVVDNVVRGGAVVDAGDDDPRVIGTRELFEKLRDDDRLDATALQTVGSKGWDGFALAVVL